MTCTTVQINEDQERMLKNFAIKQAEGAKDNQATRKPLHIVQDMKISYIDITRICNEHSYLDIDEDIVFGSNDLGNKTFDSAEECVRCYRKLHNLPCDNIKSMDEFKVFKPDINASYDNYFSFYGVDNYLIFIKQISYEPVSYHFIYEEAVRYKEYQKHNLCNPRVYTTSCGYGNCGDYEPFYDLLMTIGQSLNDGQGNVLEILKNEFQSEIEDLKDCIIMSGHPSIYNRINTLEYVISKIDNYL